MIDLESLSGAAYRVAVIREATEGLESPKDTVAMMRHCVNETFEVIDAYRNSDVLDSNYDDDELKEAFADELADVIMCCLIVAHAQGVDIEDALNKCYAKNKARAGE